MGASTNATKKGGIPLIAPIALITSHIGSEKVSTRSEPQPIIPNERIKIRFAALLGTSPSILRAYHLRLRPRHQRALHWAWLEVSIPSPRAEIHQETPPC